MKNDHSETWNYSPISTLEEGKDVIVMTESDWSWTCSWQTSTTFYVTPSTLSYDNSASWDAEKTLYANIQVGASEYVKLAMESDGHNYSGAPIYKTTFYSPFGGVHRIQFQVYDGEEFKGEKIFVKTDPEPDWSHSECLTNISNKIYNGTSWLTYGRDITIYAVPEIMNGGTWNEGTHSLYANFKYGDGDGEWVKVQMDKTSYTYKANPIYSATMFIRYNVIKRVEFLYNDGSDHELYVYVPSPQHVTGDIDDKIFIGAVSDIPTWNESYVRDYDIYYDINGGEWQSGWVGKRSYGEGDQDLSSDVTKLDYNFAGWYDNSEFAGSAYTAVSSTLADNIVLYAKWEPFSKSNFTPALNPIICTAAAGDVVVVAVSATQSDGAYIRLEDKDGVAFGSPVPVSGAGDYAIPLTASDAAKVNAGLIVSGSNYTISDVTIKYQKTLWTGTVSDNKGWTQSGDIGHSIFADLSADDFLGVYISAVNDGESWHQYALRANYENQFSGTTTVAPTTKTHQLTSSMVTALKDEKVKDITAQYLDISALYTYIDTINYTVEEHNNGGRIWADSVGNYTFGVGATLPTDVNKWGYKFDGWYDNEELSGEPVTEITTSDYGNKEYWAKWTSIEETMLSGSHPEFLAAQEGDILVITVTNTQPRAQIYLQSTDYKLCIGSKWIAGTGAGKHVIRLTASAATALHTGVIITGENYTKSSVALLYKKTIWSEGVADEGGWSYETISDRTGFAGIADGDYLGFTVTDLYDKDNKDNQYFMQYKNEEFITSAGIDETGTYFEVVPSEGADKLKTGKEDLTIAAKYLTLSELNRYLTTRDYTVTLNTNGGTINADNVTSYRYQTGATLPTDVTKTGYSFAGWYENEELDGDAVTTITTSDLGNKTYYAKWKFVIYRTGDAPDGGGGIETFDGGSIDSPIEYRMKVHTLDQWNSLYLPFTVDAIKVIEDGVYYDIQPYYRPEVGGTLYQGHYFIRTPAKTEDFEIANFSDWRDPSSYVFTPSGNTPYVIMWHNSYFLNKYIAFIGHKDDAIPEAMTVGDRPTKDSVVNVYGNDAMVSGSVKDGYTLEPDYGNGSWLREETIGDSRTVLPFECYLRANTATTPIFKVVRKQDVTTAIPMTNDPLSMPHKVLINGQVVILRDNKMYNVLGIEIQ
ncbi:MAG: InlB B-repeat-containing protein [Paludibacteraceae bacterium]|nr:InlB B-repeat-containing protein [Paludibacteraceae bacterium]